MKYWNSSLNEYLITMESVSLHVDLTTSLHPLCSGVVSEPTHQVAEEERFGTELHADQPGRAGRGDIGERGGRRGVQQALGSRLWRRQDPAATAQTPQGFLRSAPRATLRVTLRVHARATWRKRVPAALHDRIKMLVFRYTRFSEPEARSLRTPNRLN